VSPSDVTSTPQLLASLLVVRGAAVTHEERLAAGLEGLGEHERLSAVNLIHYLAVRQFDLRPEQQGLSQRGLSSLGRAEAHVLATLDATISRLANDVGRVDLPHDLGARGPSATLGDELLAARASAAFGPAAPGRATRVMVTLPSNAATDPDVVDGLVEAGMAIARINAAHDDHPTWMAMVSQVSAAAARHRRAVRIAVDLPGPKLRVGQLPDGPRVVRVRPTRDELGIVDVPVEVRFVAAGSCAVTDVGPLDAERGERVAVTLADDVVEATRPGDLLTLVDLRGRSRALPVAYTRPGEVIATTDRTAYLEPGLRVECRRDGELVAAGPIGDIPARPGTLRVARGQVVRIRSGNDRGTDALRREDGSVAAPATISVDIPQVFTAIAEGHRVLFDDGKAEGVVVAATTDSFDVRIDRPQLAKIRAGKGINLPDTALRLPALDDDDLATLRLMAPHVDLVAMSYVGDVHDVDQIHAELDRIGARDLGVILKIEHRAAFEALPRMLLRALRRTPAAVMIARGDLAVEVGFERLAELQEEILWFTEAAHIPVIWATQVLESLAKSGAPTRSEVTDAAWAARSECVMLNKGPFVDEAIRFLDDVLTRMNAHGHKRTPMLRRLAVAEALGPLLDRPAPTARPVTA
jgi:pyruvate kinase